MKIHNLFQVYLLYLLSHPLTQEDSKNKILIETTLPNIADRWKQVRVPIEKNSKNRKSISEQVEVAIQHKKASLDIIKSFEGLIT